MADERLKINVVLHRILERRYGNGKVAYPTVVHIHEEIFLILCENGKKRNPETTFGKRNSFRRVWNSFSEDQRIDVTFSTLRFDSNERCVSSVDGAKKRDEKIHHFLDLISSSSFLLLISC